MANILAVGTTAANSADFVLAVGEEATLLLVDAAGPTVAGGARVSLQSKDSAGNYFTIFGLSAVTNSVVVQAKGTYRVSRAANSISCGVDRT